MIFPGKRLMFTKARKDFSVRIVLILAFIFGWMEVVSVQASTIIHYVKWDASGANNGTSWTDAYTNLQSALSAASSGDEIWVVAGTYKPTTSTDCTISFTLKKSMAIYGGFAGTETLRTQRNPLTNGTTLSGNIGIPSNNTDNSYHVVIGSDTNNTAVLDGFRIRNGNADNIDSEPHFEGGGMYIANGSPTLRNLFFFSNVVTYSIVEGGYVGTGNLDLDPLLGALSYNGGSAATMALLTGSPATDAGNDANCPSTDQRGVTHPQGSHCDIEAYEFVFPSFDPMAQWTTDYSYNAQQWRVEYHPRMTGDFNGDGRDDLIGFGYDRVLVAPSK
jgi:hypothetical protein